jgi:hypothetical protein
VIAPCLGTKCAKRDTPDFIDICTNVVEPDDDKELFRLMKGNEESGRSAYPALLDLARRLPTEEWRTM